ncbi:MAG: metal ABC transporter ATP-binding protein [Fischerella sp.]|jgi:zinc/manganese transport system ATP-binding protein|uniref:metal ABC transporter ATP-binding protein n=1 Tax=Fischerella sp. TaxID=1191 RepID=UPI0018432FBE|nr:metal ABC transporter ATP-binding protein [Fischerella sp.]NWF60690.1 metal ABC transporter ATP-binding protein [Fischerella sp.]
MNIDIPVVKVEGLSVYKGSYLAVRDVSFELLPGTNTAIVGPNGGGKSTLVQAVLDLIPRSSGNIEIFGLPISRLGHLRHQLGYMPQHFIFDRSFPISVGELVGLGWVKEGKREKGKGKREISFFKRLWQQNQEKAAAVVTALRRTDTYHLRNQAIGTLSGGQLKRVLLAYCLVMPRRLLVLDEAFAGVDVQGAADFYTLLNELKQEEGWTILQVSHDIDLVSRYCDRVICLNQTIVCTGVPEIALSPQNLLATYGPGFSRYQHHH